MCQQLILQNVVTQTFMITNTNKYCEKLKTLNNILVYPNIQYFLKTCTVYIYSKILLPSLRKLGYSVYNL